MPYIIKDHRKNMIGVDRYDQKLSYYVYPHSCKNGGSITFTFFRDI